MGRAVEFIFRGDVQRLFDHFTDLFGVRIAFYSLAGTELSVGRDRPGCGYCRKLRDDLDLGPTCRKLDRDRRAEAASRSEMVVYRCHGGMSEAVVPVLVGGDCIGFVMIGQFRTSERMPPALRARYRRLHDDDLLAEEFAIAPYFSPEKAESLLALFDVLVRFIVAERMISVASRNPLEPLLAYIAEHPEEHLSLAEAARMTYRSESALAHAFKREVGQSFKQYQIEQRLDLADELLGTKAGVTVREVAARLGYADPLYFSRLYRRHRGHPPSAKLGRRGRRERSPT